MRDEISPTIQSIPSRRPSPVTALQIWMVQCLLTIEFNSNTYNTPLAKYAYIRQATNVDDVFFCQSTRQILFIGKYQ
jgi:hypothetical protein